MPLEIIISEGLVTETAAQEMHAQIGGLFLELHGLRNNQFMLPNVIGEVTVVPQGRSFAGLTAKNIAIVEMRVPGITFGERAQKDEFVAGATAIVEKATGGKLPKQNIWVNAVFAVDGIWGIGGKNYSNAELGEALSKNVAAA